MLRRIIVACALVLTLATCRSGQRMETFAPPGHDQFAREYIASVRSGDFERGVASLLPQLVKLPGVRDSLVAAVRVLPAGGDSLRLIGVTWNRTKNFSGGDMLHSKLVYEYQAPTGWGLVRVGVTEELGIRFIDGIRAHRFDSSQAATNDFTFAGKAPVHYAVLLLAIASLVASLSYAAAAAFTPMPRRWLWALLALMGGSGLVLNWTTGQTQFVLLSINFLGAGFRRSGAGPWLITAAVPIGAILTAMHLQKFRAKRAAAAAAEVPPTTEHPTPAQVAEDGAATELPRSDAP